ncbi:hypothetical protein AAG570_006837 [Ranatra chinensis]|uniref:Uncharacterized protein n=1 Tax=Ranatra chinensis TaxID=642074 RepID=A0ABD0YV76_9HEMI
MNVYSWRLLLVVLVGAGLAVCSPLGSSQKEDEVTSKSGGEAKSRHTRQIAFLPFIAVPPVYQVHQVILVQPDRCSSRPGLEDRFGQVDGNGPATEGPAPPTPEEPSKCVWSIVACCAPGSRNIRYSCFELLGCPGAFWDTNPCDEKVVAAAANTALRFYEGNSTSNKP